MRGGHQVTRKATHHTHTATVFNTARRRTQRETRGPDHSLNLTLAALQQINNFIGKCMQMPQIYLFFSVEEENSRGTNQHKANVILVFNLSCRDQGNRNHLHLSRAPWAYQAWSHPHSVLGVGREEFYCLGFTDVEIWAHVAQDHIAFKQQDCGF